MTRRTGFLLRVCSREALMAEVAEAVEHFVGDSCSGRPVAAKEGGVVVLICQHLAGSSLFARVVGHGRVVSQVV